MNVRLTKEFRPLWLPWGLAALGAICYFAERLNPQVFSADFRNLIFGLGGFAFGFGVLLLCALPMGVELNERTLLLLLSQPADRARLWRDKLIAAAVFTLALGAVHAISAASTGQLDWPKFIIFAAVTVATLCSVGYHVLAAGSLIVGIATALGTPWALALSAHLFVYYVLRIQIELTESQTVLLVSSACAIYSVVFLWLSKRQFATLELKVAAAGRVAEIPRALVPGSLAALTQPRPSDAIGNLVRKEISLQKPIFLVGAIFTACWLATLLLMFLRPSWHDELQSVFNGLTGTQVILMAILTGSVALGDDKALGTAGWHLTLPVSARTQWRIKLFVALGTFIAMAILLPTLLAALTSFKATVGMLTAGGNTWKAFGVISLFLFAISFWSATLSRNTIRAVLVTMGALVAMGTCASAAAWFSNFGLQEALVANLAGRFHISFEGLSKMHSEFDPYAAVILAMLAALFALIQSARLFRCLQLTRREIAKHCTIFGILVFLGVSYAADLEKSLRSASVRLNTEIYYSFSSLPDLPKRLAAGEPWQVTPAQLAQAGRLSRAAERWLEGSTITVTPSAPHLNVQIAMPNREPVAMVVTLAWPDRYPPDRKKGP